MRKIEINSKAFITTPNEKKYIILGAKDEIPKEKIDKEIIPKIVNKPSPPVKGLWGTLGMSNDEQIKWEGHLEISQNGNKKAIGVVKEEVDQIKACFPNANLEKDSIIERFISFEHVDFEFPESFTLEEMPSLRLELFLEQHEGAVVFYQSDKDTTHEDTVIEYILPQATEGHYTNERDRLKYHIDIIPQKKIVEVDGASGFYRLGTSKAPKPFIVKIITFSRGEIEKSFDKSFQRETSADIIKAVHEELSKQNIINKIAKDHVLLVFDTIANDFKKATTGNIDNTKKTLFLMHGTFGSTEASFGKLYGGKRTWLKSLLDKKNPNAYEQILAFDHPTVFNGAKENIAILLKQLENLKIKPFKHEVDFIGTSQGGLLVQYLANLIDNDQIKVGKAALVASANGVEYFTVGKYIAKFLSALKYIFKITQMQGQALVASLAQHSAEFFLKQPGFEIMTPNNPKLLEIINVPPVNSNTRYWPIVDDYKESIIDDKDWNKFKKFAAKMGARLVDSITKKILGEENDWVVGSRNQFIVPSDYCAIPGYNPAKFRENLIPAIHGSCINHKDAKKAIEKFLFGSGIKPKISEDKNFDYFDAHCHIFGREVISGRILLLLIQDFLSYRKYKDRTDKLSEIPYLLDYAHKSNEGQTGSVAKNIINYFALNKNSYAVLNDLEDEYYNLKSNVYRYIPLMFDLEMTFRNKYSDHNIDHQISETEKEFKSKLNDFKDDIDELIKKFDDKKEIIYYGSLVDNEESVKMLKIIKICLNVLKVANLSLNKDTITGYYKQLDELIGLKVRYGNDIFPFLAVDPRRKDMGKLIEEYVGKNKPFHGIKLYAPNGYSPTDPHLFDDSYKFVHGKSLYSYCLENKIPIMAHCSNAGFATFTANLEVCGDIYTYNEDSGSSELVHYNTPTEIIFESSITNGGFKEAVRERAHVLNHPDIWREVLKKYKNLKICLAHFGGESPVWRERIAQLMRDYPKVYTDLSCMVSKNRLKEIKTQYFDSNDPITERIMYGSDFFLNMLNKIKFKDYYKHFIDTGMFSTNQMDQMAIHVPKKFLGILS